MSISPAQMSLDIVNAQSSAAAGHAAPAPASPVSAVTSAAESASSVSAPAAPPSNPVATDLRIDNQHQFYYEFVDDSTGSVEFEIPPEALRAIGESLNLPLQGDGGTSSIDVKS
jgi:hypothetical protein